MIKNFILFLFLLPIVSYTTETFPKETLMVNEIDNSDSLLKAAKAYLDFVGRISRGETFPQHEIAATVLAPDCKKVLNGQLFTHSREDFVSDLLSVYKNQGGWKITPAEILVSPANNAVILRLFVEMDKLGKYTEIVILRYNPSYLVTEINLVFTQVKGSYDFN